MRALSLLTSLLALLPTAISTQEPLLGSAHNHNVSAALFSELEELARLVDITYCIGSPAPGITPPFNCLSRCSGFPRFSLVTTWNTGPLLSDSCGYIALDHGKERIVVAFRGTYSIANTVVDLSTIPQEYTPFPGTNEGDEPKCHNCTVHAGFQTSWTHTRKEILVDLETQLKLWPHYSLHLVGHSLGGAVAGLAGLDLLARGYDPTITTFGEPRLGNQGLVNYIDARFQLKPKRGQRDMDGLHYRRVTHIDDPIPLLPLTEWGFAMHAGEIFITNPSLSPDIADLRHCIGDNDKDCIAGQDSTIETKGQVPQPHKRDLRSSVLEEVNDVVHEPWGIPSRYKLWQLFFAHRDYFWRLGLCVPGGDPLGGGRKHGDIDGFEEAKSLKDEMK